METRTCSDCSPSLPLAAFTRSGSEVQSRCKPCFNRTCVERWRRVKAEEVKRLGGRRPDSDEASHPDVFELHHLDPRGEEYGWTRLRLFSADRRRRELAKCVVLCAPCHRMRHVVAEAEWRIPR